MNHHELIDESNIDDCEWDPAKSSFMTAWSTIAPKKTGRRAYGRRTSKAPVARMPLQRSNSVNKKRTLNDSSIGDLQGLARSSSASSAEHDSKSESFSRASFSSSSSELWGIDSSNNENSLPNLLHESSPLPPTKVKKVQAKSSPENTSPSGGSSFSNLAKSDMATLTWASSASSNRPVFVPQSPPPRVSSPVIFSSSEGKPAGRGICASPLDTWSASTSHRTSSPSSYQSGTKSKSRVFPLPDLTAATKPPLTKNQNNNGRRRKMDLPHDSDESDSEVPKSTEVSFESAGSTGIFDTEEDYMPPMPRRRASLEGFQETVFGKSPKKTEVVTSTSETSLQDMKFLIRELRKQQRRPTVAGFSGSQKTWMVIPPAKWSADRRTQFLQWTKGLGFALRSAGGASGSMFVQTNSTKGAEMLSSLETCYHEKRKEEAKAVTKKEVKPLFVSIPLDDRTKKSLPLAHRKFSPSADRKVDDHLSSLVDSMSLDESRTITTETARGPLVRKVTLEAATEMTYPQQQSVATLPCFLEEDESSFDGDKPSRLSDEHHVGGQELVQHLHVWSPRRTSRDVDMRRCSSSSSKTHGVLSRLSRIPRNSVSPMVGGMNTSCSKPSAKSCLEFVETPMQMWGSSRPNYNGRDWGASTPCEAQNISKLLGFLNQVYDASGQATRSPLGIEGSECLSYFEEPVVVLSSSDLGFELEADDADIAKGSHTLDPREPKMSPSPLLAVPETDHARRTSVGSTFFAELTLNDDGSPSSLQSRLSVSPGKTTRRKMLSLAKRRRMSLCASAAMDPMIRLPAVGRHTMFSNKALNNPTPEAEAFSLSDRTSSFPLWGIEEVASPTADHKPLKKSPVKEALENSKILVSIFMFLREPELVQSASVVSTAWADASTEAYASLMLISVGCSELFGEGDDDFDESDDENSQIEESYEASSIAHSMERPWNFLVNKFPWASFLSDGAYKSVYKVFNAAIRSYEAVSIMDVSKIDSLGQKQVVGAELAVSVMLSSLTRRNVCPNFVITRGVFTCAFAPPPNFWGCEEKKHPMGKKYVPGRALPKEPSERGRYQYIRMELCCKGDAENYIKDLPCERMESWELKSILFQTAFALHAAGAWYSMKHYDLKLLNIFLQDANAGCTYSSGSHTVLRYGLGRHVFAIRMPSNQALIAKLADYGTANVQAETDGQPVKISQFTTPENTPPEFMILGDAAKQGYGHDCFNLGLCLLHLSTGYRPYEEILEDVECPPILQKKLERIWEDEGSSGYEVIRSVILSDVDVGEDGAMEGEPDPVFYHTLYRFLVLFGIPERKYRSKDHGRVWKAIASCLESSNTSRPRRGRRNTPKGTDADIFERHRDEYSLGRGKNKYIARARTLLENSDGGMELLLSLVDFDPQRRATALDVLNSKFMRDLLEDDNKIYPGDTVHSYMSFHSATNQRS